MVIRIFNDAGSLVRTVHDCEFNIDGDLALVRGLAENRTKIHSWYVDLTRFLMCVEEPNDSLIPDTVEFDRGDL